MNLARRVRRWTSKEKTWLGLSFGTQRRRATGCLQICLDSLVDWCKTYPSPTGFAHAVQVICFVVQGLFTHWFLYMYANNSFRGWTFMTLLAEIPLLFHFLWFWREESAFRAAPTQWLVYSWVHAAKVVVLFCRVMPRLSATSSSELQGAQQDAANVTNYMTRANITGNESAMGENVQEQTFEFFSPTMLGTFLLITPVVYALLMFRTSKAIFRSLSHSVTVDLLMHYDMMWHVVIDMVDQVDMFYYSRIAQWVGESKAHAHRQQLIIMQTVVPILLFLSMTLQAQALPGVAVDRWAIPEGAPQQSQEDEKESPESIAEGSGSGSPDSRSPARSRRPDESPAGGLASPPRPCSRSSPSRGRSLPPSLKASSIALRMRSWRSSSKGPPLTPPSPSPTHGAQLAAEEGSGAMRGWPEGSWPAASSSALLRTEKLPPPPQSPAPDSGASTPKVPSTAEPEDIDVNLSPKPKLLRSSSAPPGEHALPNPAVPPLLDIDSIDVRSRRNLSDPLSSGAGSAAPMSGHPPWRDAQSQHVSTRMSSSYMVQQDSLWDGLVGAWAASGSDAGSMGPRGRASSIPSISGDQEIPPQPPPAMHPPPTPSSEMPAGASAPVARRHSRLAMEQAPHVNGDVGSEPTDGAPLAPRRRSRDALGWAIDLPDGGGDPAAARRTPPGPPLAPAAMPMESPMNAAVRRSVSVKIRRSSSFGGLSRPGHSHRLQLEVNSLTYDARRLQKTREKDMKAIEELIKRQSIVIARKRSAMVSIFFTDVPFLMVRIWLWMLLGAPLFPALAFKNAICLVLNVMQYTLVRVASREAYDEIHEKLSQFQARFGSGADVSEEASAAAAASRGLAVQRSPSDFSGASTPNMGAKSPFGHNAKAREKVPEWVQRLPESRRQVRQDTQRASGVCVYFWALMMAFFLGFILTRGWPFLEKSVNWLKAWLETFAE